VNNPSSLDDTARVFVVIHADSLAGSEIGTSDEVFIPKPGRGFSSGGDFWYRTGDDLSPVVAGSWGALKRRYPAERLR
jgi:hypothetical protein